jgi:Salmonella virulence plasmid 65kDa B protein
MHVYILSGQEDLVPTLREDAHGLAADEFERDGYRIKRYRPRVEGLNPRESDGRVSRMAISTGERFQRTTS